MSREALCAAYDTSLDNGLQARFSSPEFASVNKWIRPVPLVFCCTLPPCLPTAASVISAPQPTASSTSSPPANSASGRFCRSALPATAVRPTRRSPHSLATRSSSASRGWWTLAGSPATASPVCPATKARPTSAQPSRQKLPAHRRGRRQTSSINAERRRSRPLPEVLRGQRLTGFTDYAMYTVLRRRFNYASWHEWPEELLPAASRRR